MSRPTLTEYRAKIAAMTNRELIAETAAAILGAAVMAPMHHNDGWNDDQADACYDEAIRRGNTDLYQRGYNSAVCSQGHYSMARGVDTPIDIGEPTQRS